MPPHTTQPAAQHIRIRLIVQEPVPGVALAVQRGRDELIPPVSRTADAVTFELEIEVRPNKAGVLAVRGPEIQGPPDARFIYINVGTYAGEYDSKWNRRTKIPLKGLHPELIADALAKPQAVLVAKIHGRARDGGPAAATVPLLDNGWEIVDAKLT